MWQLGHITSLTASLNWVYFWVWTSAYTHVVNKKRVLRRLFTGLCGSRVRQVTNELRNARFPSRTELETNVTKESVKEIGLKEQGDANEFEEPEGGNAQCHANESAKA